eukprot:2859938-Prymnesium_polylepis.1
MFSAAALVAAYGLVGSSTSDSTCRSSPSYDEPYTCARHATPRLSGAPKRHGTTPPPLGTRRPLTPLLNRVLSAAGCAPGQSVARGRVAAAHLVGGHVDEALDADVLGRLDEHVRAHHVVLGERERVAK